MNLYRKLFGLNLMKPLDDGDTGGGGAVDRGDNFDAGDQTADDQSAANAGASEDDLEVATGEENKDGAEGDQPRDATGKFAKKDRETTIPKSRFDEQVRKERERADAAERRLAEIEQQRQQVARGADIGKLEDEVKELRAKERKALIAGDDKTATEMSEQADRLNRQIAIEQARDMTAAAKESAREEIRWDMTLESIEKQYPALDETSEHFDQDLSDDVLDAMSGIMRRERLPRSQAMVKAVQKVMDRQKGAEAAETEGKGLRSAAKEEDRKEAAVKKNVDAANRQPASTKKVGADSDKHGQNKEVPDANDMTFEEFSALPDTTKAKMRGDYV